MAKRSGRRKRRNKARSSRQQQQQQQQSPRSSNICSSCASANSNFVAEAGPGCYIARKEDDNVERNDWLLEWQDMDDFFDDDDGDSLHCESMNIPDIALDPDERTVTFCNSSPSKPKVAYITIYNAIVAGRMGQVLPNGKTVDKHGRQQECITFIVLCPPKTFCCLCTVVQTVQDGGCSSNASASLLDNLVMDSDVHDYKPHSNPNDEHSYALGFPLLLTNNHNDAFLCTQSEGGHLTHFVGQNWHALDFACDIGTPLAAVADGVVVDVNVCVCKKKGKTEDNKDDNDKNSNNNSNDDDDDGTTTLQTTGIAVSNLFEWNSIMIQVDTQDNHDPLFVEYVHISTSNVQVGDVVKRGQVIGTSGSVGFSPEPHLHLSAYRSSERTAETVRVKFQPTDGEAAVFVPMAGQWYTANGRVDASHSPS